MRLLRVADSARWTVLFGMLVCMNSPYASLAGWRVREGVNREFIASVLARMG
jgi:hypothetical protein